MTYSLGPAKKKSKPFPTIGKLLGPGIVSANLISLRSLRTLSYKYLKKTKNTIFTMIILVLNARKKYGESGSFEFSIIMLNFPRKMKMQPDLYETETPREVNC